MNMTKNLKMSTKSAPRGANRSGCPAGAGSRSLARRAIHSASGLSVTVFAMAAMGCQPTLNRLPSELPTVTRVAVVTKGEPQLVVSIGSSTSADFYESSLTDSAAATTEYALYDILKKATPPAQVQTWFTGALTEALFDSFPKLIESDEAKCDARLVVEIGRYGLVAASARSVVHMTLGGEVRMLRCDDDNGIWRHSIDRSEPVRNAQRSLPGGGSGTGASLDLMLLTQMTDEDVQFIVERLSAGAAVAAVSAMKRDANAPRDDTGEATRR